MFNKFLLWTSILLFSHKFNNFRDETLTFAQKHFSIL